MVRDRARPQRRAPRRVDGRDHRRADLVRPHRDRDRAALDRAIHSPAGGRVSRPPAAMFATCAFCSAKFDGDGGPSGLGLGRRIAFDEWKGRLWVVCPQCARWNLTPLDDRLEHIEAVARCARDGSVLARTEQVALIRWQRYDLIQVGKPPRVELAGWRYGERLKQRSRERAKVVVPLTLAAIGLGVAANVAAGGSVGFLVWNFGRLADQFYVGMVGRRRVNLSEPPICPHCGT